MTYGRYGTCIEPIEPSCKVLRCVAEDADLPAVGRMLDAWWGPDLHARRIAAEIRRQS